MMAFPPDSIFKNMRVLVDPAMAPDELRIFQTPYREPSIIDMILGNDRMPSKEALNEQKETLARDIMNLAAVAANLGFVVIAEDMRAAARLVKQATPKRNFSRPEDRWRWK